jgi:hypothetical protein
LRRFGDRRHLGVDSLTDYSRPEDKVKNEKDPARDRLTVHPMPGATILAAVFSHKIRSINNKMR